MEIVNHVCFMQLPYTSFDKKRAHPSQEANEYTKYNDKMSRTMPTIGQGLSGFFITRALGWLVPVRFNAITLLDQHVTKSPWQPHHCYCMVWPDVGLSWEVFNPT